MSDVILEVKDLKKYFDTPKGKLQAVDGVSFKVERGKTLGIVGESGCGKSMTAMSIINLLPKHSKITSGEIWFNKEDLLKYLLLLKQWHFIQIEI